MFPETARDEVLIEALGDELVVYDLVRHRAHCLNKSAALVWRHCDGKTTIAELAKLLQKELGLPDLDEDLVGIVQPVLPDRFANFKAAIEVVANGLSEPSTRATVPVR